MTTLAVTPASASLIALARPLRLSFAAVIVTVHRAGRRGLIVRCPRPTASVLRGRARSGRGLRLGEARTSIEAEAAERERRGSRSRSAHRGSDNARLAEQAAAGDQAGASAAAKLSIACADQREPRDLAGCRLALDDLRFLRPLRSRGEVVGQRT